MDASKVLLVFDPTHVIGKAAALLVSIGLSFLGITWLDRSSPVIIAGGEVRPDTVRAGNWAEVFWHIRWKSHCSSVILNQQLVSPSGAVTPLESVRVAQVQPSNSFVEVGRPFHVPWTWTAGTGRYEATVIAECNPVQALFPLTVSAPNVPFAVKESPVTTQERMLDLPH